MAGRRLTVFPDDTFLLSYPKSGNTWLRFWMGNLLHPNDPLTFLKMEERIRSIYTLPDHQLRQITKPRFLTGHECFDPRYKKVIYIVRDPRDVLISSYWFHTKLRAIPEGYPMDAYVSRWLAADVYDLPSFGTWNEHVLSWLATRRDHPGFLLLRYEDMKRNPEREIARVACFMGVNASPQRLARVIELSSADRMRELEKTEHHSWAVTRGSRTDIPFVGKGVSGDWQSILAAEMAGRIEAAFGATMKSLGYELTQETAAVSTLPHSQATSA